MDYEQGLTLWSMCLKSQSYRSNNILVKISENLKGSYSVPLGTTKICGGAFGSSGLTSIQIPNTVTYIGRRAFSFCGNLQSINIPNSITSIEEGLFDWCSKLESVKLPSSVVEIKRGAFNKCEKLKYVLIENPNCVIAKGALDRIYIARNEGDVLKAEGGYSAVSKIANNNTTYYIVKKNGAYGLVNAKGGVIIPCEMAAIEQCGTGFLRFKIGDYWGVMNYQGKTIIPTSRGYTSIGNYISSQKRFTYTMYGFKGECDNLGRQLSHIKAPIPQPSQTTTTSTTASSNNVNTQSNVPQQQTIIVEQQRTPVPVQEWVPCGACGNSAFVGLCQSCYGSGISPYRDERCFNCKGNRKCTHCAGNGGRYVTVYR